MAQILDTKSYWVRTASLPSFPPLDRNVTADVVVVGGGLVGVTTAYLLKMAGLTVALLERGKCAAIDTGHTTAHLTMVTDEFVTDLVTNFGRDAATAAWQAGRVAIDTIEANVAMEDIACDFRRVPGYLHEALDGGGLSPDALREQAATAADLGFEAAFVPSIRPFNVAAVQYPQQALFHPRKYLDGLLRAVHGDGSVVYENSPADTVTDDPLTVHSGAYSVSCSHVVLATHTPRVGKASAIGTTLLQSKLAPYTTYAIGGRLPTGRVPHALYWDTKDPYHYLRVEPADGYDYAIFGGADHKTGQEEHTSDCWTTIEERLRRQFPEFELMDRWSGQVIETNDGLPYIGENASRQFVATGFAGNGMTFGTIAAMMARDWVLGRSNPWRELFDPHRKNLRGGAWDYVKENKDYAYYMLRDRVFARHAKSLSSVRPGEGKVVYLDGTRVAVYRDPRGVLSMVSAACTHMDCEVHFNSGETSWDCPCHGSRFRVDGSIIAGPAERPLSPHGDQRQADGVPGQHPNTSHER
jgi:glycine/D-amino acid oxidase-like deaminating enzyme/nitrite reductase/ring-hydroxylating ferredoxin subunit